MDKIITGDWADIFSRKEEQLIHSSDRYAEVLSSFAEPGLASGTFRTIVTPGITLSNIHFSSERKLKLVDRDQSEGITSLFTLEGGVESKFNSLKKPVSFQDYKHGFQYNTSFESEHIIQTGSFHAFSLTYNIDFFKSLVQTSESGALDKVANSMVRKESFMAPPAMLFLQPRMAAIIQAIENCSFQGLTKYLFIEAKMLELFALQVEQINHNINSKLKDKEICKPGDMEKLKAVRNFIEHNYLKPLSLTELTFQFGLNEFKLKKGYKQLFKTTVFGHILQLRMQKAQQLLSQKQMNVSETAYYIGYNNVSSFSAEFKKQFGYSPGRS